MSLHQLWDDSVFAGFSLHKSQRHPSETNPHKTKTNRDPAICDDGCPPAQTHPATETASRATMKIEMTDRKRFMLFMCSIWDDWTIR